MKSSHVFLRCILMFLLATGIASADVVYSFSGINAFGTSETFQYTAPSLIPDNIQTGLDTTKWTFLTPADLESCPNCAGDAPFNAPVWFEPNAGDGVGCCFDTVRFYGNNDSTSLYVFALGTFSTSGIYHTLGISGGDIATLQVGTVVPEPSSQWLLVSLVSLMIGLTARRRYRSPLLETIG